MSARILIVDDAPFMRRTLAKVVRERGWLVAGEAANGREAVASYLTLRPDVVLMDITMPEVNGIAAVKEIVGQDPKARIVICSALGQEDMVIEAVRAGARDFVVKPFQADRVAAAVEAQLAR